MKWLNYLFDLDGTLANTTEIHHQSQIESVKMISGYDITKNKNLLDIFNSSITTKKKLDFLLKENIISLEQIDIIYEKKTELANNLLGKLNYDPDKVNLFKFLKEKKCKIGIVTNSSKISSTIVLKSLGIFKYIDILITNNDVKNTKPHSEPYIRAISEFGGDINKYIIFEDSEDGLISAKGIGCDVYHVKNIKDINIELIRKMNNIENINILIPMAGKGSRFTKRGFKSQKPLIKLNEKTLIEHAIESLNIDGNYIFIIRREINESNKELIDILNNIKPDCKIIEIDYITEGSASTCYLAKEYINNNDELIITNCDQILEWDSANFLKKSKDYDCCVLTYNSNDKKNSFIKTDKNNIGIEIIEKEVISDNALVGVHYFKKGSDFISSYNEIFKNNKKFKNEYYTSTVCDNLIKNNKLVYNIKLTENQKYYSTGTPECYFKYLKEKGLLNTKLYKMKDMFRGWYIGNFEPAAYKTKTFEAGYLIHKKGEMWDVHYHEHIKEINFLVKGKMILNDLEINEGDIFIIDKYEIACPIFLEDCYIFVIKVPSVIGDKVIL
tara:strand:- start:7952 stop:9619 length:1668 start_codon:yes stop_codon:yes gene_type:complete